MTVSEAWVDFIAGWASGAAAVLACQPTDTVLTRLQAGSWVGATTTTAVTAAAAPSAQQITRSLVNSFGLASLWRGSSPMISAVPVQNSLLMGGYGIGKQWAELEGSSNKYAPIFVGGCTGGVVQSFLMSPVEWIKVRTQVEGQNTFKATHQLWKNHAMRRGLTATLLRDGIPHGVWFVSYEWCKTSLDEQNTALSDVHRQLSIPLASGAFAATLAWAVGYPADIIKTRIQASPNNHTMTIMGTAKELIQEANGRVIAGLYKGFGLKLVRSVPASMIGFTTYEWVAEKLRGSEN